MKKYLLIAGLFLGVTAVKAQQPNPPSPEERLKHTKEVLQQEVNPGDEQLKKIEEIYKQFFQSMDKLRKDNPPPPPPPPPPNVKERMDKLVKERDELVKQILTADQYKKYGEAAQKLHPPKPGEENENGMPPPPQKQ